MVAAVRRVPLRPALRASIARLGPAAALFVGLVFAPGVAAQPPVPSSPSATCGAVVGGVCYVNASFYLSTSSAGADHYRYCRSGDTTAWGGCVSTMSTNAGPLFVVSGSNLPADGYRRAYYASACDSAGNCTLWKDNQETYVTGDFSGPVAPGKTAIPCVYQNGGDCWVTGAFTMTVTPAFDAGSGVDSYTACRSQDTASWGGCNVTLAIGIGTSYTVSGSHLPADGYRRAYYFRAKDRLANKGAWNAESYVRVDRYAPTVTLSNHSTEWFSSRTATLSAADAVGGAAANSGVASLRYAWNTALDAGCTNGTEVAPGTTLSVPHGDNVLNACVRDHTGRVTKTSGIYRVDSAPPTQPGPTTVACAFVGSDCWVTGDFVASTTGSTDDGTGVAGYRFCRSFDTTSSGGCNHDVVPQGTAGTSVTVSGSDLPADGYRRAYFFRAVDGVGNWSAWNSRRYVRVDRHAPTVSATGASTQWLTTSSATVTAADEAGGAVANSGLAQVRYRWSSPLDGACTNGSPVAVGATLPAPKGDNTLYLCARDNTGRVATWSGRYRVDTTPPTLDSLTVSSGTWSIGDGSVYSITARATDSGVGVREIRALINLQGDNAANPRGNFSWRDQSLGSQWTGDALPCTGGGWASKRPDAFNPETVTLVGCTTSLSGGQRTVTFRVRPEASFGDFGPIHDISFWSRDFLLNGQAWQNFDLNFASGTRPPAVFQLRDENGVPQAYDAIISWGESAVGAENGRITKELIVRNQAALGSSNLVLEGYPSNLRLTGSGAFGIGGTLASPIVAGDRDTFPIHLDTDQTGSHESVLEIFHSDAAQPNPFRVRLTARVVAPPVVTSVIPSQIAPGGLRTVLVRGSDLFDATVVIATDKFDQDHPDRVFPLIVEQTVSADGGEITVTVDTSATGIDGIYNLLVVTPCTGCFVSKELRVAPPNQPIVDIYTPSEVSAGNIYPIVLAGANLLDATVTSSHPDVLVLDIDSSNDEMVSGLLAVPAGLDPGAVGLRIRRPDGGMTELQLSLVAPGLETKTSHFVVSEETMAEARAAGVEVPTVRLQEPTLGPGMIDKIARGEMTGEKMLSCVFSYARRIFHATRVYVVTIDELGDVDPTVLQGLGLGQVARFGTITISFFADITLQFRFDWCRLSDFGTCIFGTFGAEVVGLEGVVQSFTFCVPAVATHSALRTSGGSLTEVSMSTEGECISLIQITDPQGGGIAFQGGGRGAHYAEVRLNRCCSEPVLLEARLSTLTEVPFFGLTNFQGQVALPATQVPNCCVCSATLDDIALKPPAGSDPPNLYGQWALTGSIENQSPDACEYTVELSHVAGSPTPSFAPNNVKVTVPAGGSTDLSTLGVTLSLPAGTPAHDSAQIELTATSGQTVCAERAEACPVPKDEMSVFFEWQLAGEEAVFFGFLEPGDKADFETRIVHEVITDIYDHCWYPGSPYGPASPLMFDGGSAWDVDHEAADLRNLYGPDGVGADNVLGPVYGPMLAEGAICEIGWTQTMSIECPAPLDRIDYKVNEHVIRIKKENGASTVLICRNEADPLGCSSVRTY